ncbi:MAG: HEAT repeat domain-containing protein [Planctomycetes bacterium]|nr:HEAT repeat domain-containing protein [Planctomycetota bacterium]
MPRLLHALLIVLAVLCGGLTPAHADQDSPVALFKKYFKQYKDTPSRVEAVLTLEKVEDPAVFELLYNLLGDKTVEPDVVNAIVRVFRGFGSEAQQTQVFEALRTEKSEPTKVALLKVIGQAKWADKTGVLQVTLGDKSWQVRRFTLQALLVGGDAGVAEKVAQLCDDNEPAVRFAALDALTSFKSPLVVPKAVASLTNDSRQVKQSAIHALTVMRDRSALEPLLARMNKEEGVLILDLAEALANLTGKEFGPNPDEWNKWWAGENHETYVIPTPEGIAYLRGKREAKSGTSGGWEIPKSKVGGDFFGTKTPSRQMVFVIDCSGSMETLVTEKERFADGNYPDYSRMEIVKTELMRTIDRLEPYVKFNIISFATDVKPWKDKLQTASITVKSSAKDWVKTLYAIGGASKEDLATVGLIGAANLDKGKTNTFGALKIALGVNEVRTADQNYEKVAADTVFFLSDGRPTVGDYVDPDDILREIKSLNDLRRVIIHTIAIGEFQKDFMQRLAEQNGPGVFVDLGK